VARAVGVTRTQTQAAAPAHRAAVARVGDPHIPTKPFPSGRLILIRFVI
jgi:hypothetical protein